MGLYKLFKKLFKKSFFSLKQGLERLFHPREFQPRDISLNTADEIEQKHNELVALNNTIEDQAESDQMSALREDQLEFVMAFVPHETGIISSREVYFKT